MPRLLPGGNPACLLQKRNKGNRNNPFTVPMCPRSMMAHSVCERAQNAATRAAANGQASRTNSDWHLKFVIITCKVSSQASYRAGL